MQLGLTTKLRLPHSDAIRAAAAALALGALLSGCGEDDTGNDTTGFVGLNGGDDSSAGGGLNGGSTSSQTGLGTTGTSSQTTLGDGGFGGATNGTDGGGITSATSSNSTPPNSEDDSGVGTTDADTTEDTGTQSPASDSEGCGTAGAPPSGTYTIDVDGTQREYILELPSGYDSSKPYRLIFAWHYLGGTASAIAGGGLGGFGGGGWYGLGSRAGDSAIFVAGQGLESGLGGAGWSNSGGQDVAFAKAMLAHLRQNYCIDNTRIFSVGMSYGGIMSNTVGCQMGDEFRAIAPMAGSGPGFGFGAAGCVGQVAAWIAHGRSDTFPGVSFSNGESSRDYWVMANDCASTTQAVGPDDCVAYDGCDPGYPVHWCPFDGGHEVPSFGGEAIWDFFSQF